VPYTLLIVEDPKQRGSRTLAEGREVYDRMVKCFADLDGHVWEPMWMDPSAIPS
jgi:predicted lactoylglutathione lyase